MSNNETVPVPHEPHTEITPRARVIAAQMGYTPANIQAMIDKGWIR